MDYKSFLKFCLGAIITFVIFAIFEGEFEWDNIISVLIGGLVGSIFASYKGKNT